MRIRLGPTGKNRWPQILRKGLVLAILQLKPITILVAIHHGPCSDLNFGIYLQKNI